MKKQSRLLLVFLCLSLLCAMAAGCKGLPADDEPLSEEVQLQMKQDYLAYLGDTGHACAVEDVSLIVVSRVESGCAMFIGCKCSSFNPDQPWDELFGESAGDLLFYMPNGWYLMFYKNGDFCQLDAAFNNRWLSYEELRTVWDAYHTQFPKALETWQSVNAGLSEPPLRDSSGLDYEVNADGVTCTVTGMGVCTDLDVVIPKYIDGYQVTAIGEMAFWAQIWITSVTMPDTVTSIGQSAFDTCDQLRSIQLSASLQSISAHAFQGCKSLTDITLPGSVTYIGGGAFAGCESLTTMVIPDGVTELAASLFSECVNLVEVRFSEAVTRIGSGAFFACKRLTQIHIPQGVTVIEGQTFANCHSLTEVVLPSDVSIIGDSAFVNCTGLRRINIPNVCTQIGMRAFADCKSLEQIEIPDSVTTIGGWAFENCTALASLSIGEGTTDIDFAALKSCSAVTQIVVDPENPVYHSAGNCLIETEGRKLLLAGVNCQIPTDGSVLHIADYAFYGQTALAQIVIPDGVQSIGGEAFGNCTGLKKVYIPSSVNVLGNAFKGCKALDDIYYEGTAKMWKSIRKGTYIGDGMDRFLLHCTDEDMEVR